MFDFFSKWWWAIAGGAVGTYAVGKAISGGTPPAPPVNTVTKATSLTSYLPDDFFTVLFDMVARFQAKGAHVSAHDMLVMFLAESDCDSRIANSIGCAGLNQICNLRGVGFTGGVAAYIALPPAEQLHYVERYFDNVNRYPMMRDVGSLYLTNFSPAFLGKPDNFIMYRAGIDKAYAANKGVDFGNKGYIEVADMAKFMNAAAKRKQAKLNELDARYIALSSNA